MDVPSLDALGASSASASAIASMGPKVAIIGCGPAGMFFLRQLEKERNRLLLELEDLELEDLKSNSNSNSNSNSDESDVSTVSVSYKLNTLPQVTVFEKESRCGGLWQSKLAPTKPTTTTTNKSQQAQTGSSTDDDDDDESPKKAKAESYDEGMYDGMWINAPKEIFEFEDYTFEDHFGIGKSKNIPSYITRSQVLAYIEGATYDAMNYHIGKGNIIFNTHVTWIDEYEYDNDNDNDINESIEDHVDEDEEDDDEDEEDDDEEEDEDESIDSNSSNKKSKFKIDTIPTGTQPRNVLDDGDLEYHPDDVTSHIFDKVILANGNEALPSIPVTTKQILQPPQPQEDEDNNNNQNQNQNQNQNDNNEHQKDQIVKFNGPVLHSSQINQLGSDIHGQRFLFIGSSYSAEDLALSFIKRGASHIYVTTRSDNGYPVTVTSSWPMNKLTILHRTEIKSVLSHSQSEGEGEGGNNNNSLQMGRMDLPIGLPKEILDYYNTNDNFILENIDAIIFCTGYDTDDDILSPKLNIYNYEEEPPYNYYLNPDLIKSPSSLLEWPNIYDYKKFGEVPSEMEHNACGGHSFNNNNNDNNKDGSKIDEYDHTPILRADPSIGLWHHQYLGMYNNHLINNPNFYKHRVETDTPLLGLDISSAFILKVMIEQGSDIEDTNTTIMTKDEMFIENSRDMFHDIRHSQSTRYNQDEIFRNAYNKLCYIDDVFADDESMCVYNHGYRFFKLFLKAYKAGHPAGSMIMKITNNNINNNNNNTDYYDDKDGRRPVYTDRYGYNNSDSDSSIEYDGDDIFHDFHIGTKWTFTDRGMKFINFNSDSMLAHEDIPTGTNLTFRDMYYDSYQSIYTGIKPRKFTKLWLYIDDILGDIVIDDVHNDGDTATTTTTTTRSSISISDGDGNDDDDDKGSSCLHCEQHMEL